jgi:hypothetical protein
MDVHNHVPVHKNMALTIDVKNEMVELEKVNLTPSRIHNTLRVSLNIYSNFYNNYSNETDILFQI